MPDEIVKAGNHAGSQRSKWNQGKIMTAATSADLGVCGDYRLVRKLGAGGMGEVFLAEHRTTGRICAIKRHRTGDPAAIGRIEAESNALRQLAHRNAVRFLDWGITDDGRPYLVMEFLPGRALDELVNHLGPLPQQPVVAWLRQLCSVLLEIHRLGLIHRDVKPANIMLMERERDVELIKLLDFGLAVSTTASRAHAAAETAFSGSPHYAAPEAAQGVAAMDARSDIYSLGATAYHLLTGRPVFPGHDPVNVIFAHADQSPQPLTAIRPEIAADLEAIVMKCLAKQPEDRFQSVEDVELALAAIHLSGPSDSDDVADWSTSNLEFSPQPTEASAAAATYVNLGDTK